MGGGFAGARSGLGGTSAGYARGSTGSHERGHFGARGGERFHHARHFRRGFDNYGYGYTCDYDSPYYSYDCNYGVSPYGYGG